MKHLSFFRPVLLTASLLVMAGYAYSQTEPQPLPVAWYTMTGEDSTVYSTSGQLNGTLKNMADSAAYFVDDGKIGRAIQFAGQPDSAFVQTPAFDYQSTGQFSICFWMEIDTTGHGNQMYPLISGAYGDPNTALFRCKLDENPMWFRFHVWDEYGADAFPHLKDGLTVMNMFEKKWMFVVGTATVDSVNCYIDGVSYKRQKVALSGFDTNINLSTVKIGASGSGSSSFKGKIDEVRFYDYALTGDQVNSLMGISTHVPGLKTEEFKLGQYPNPFSGETTISYTLPKAGKVSLEIFNINGQMISTLVKNQYQQADRYTQRWNCKDGNGNSQPAGLYFYKLKVDGVAAGIGKMILQSGN